MQVLLVYPPYESLRNIPIQAVPWNLLLLATIMRDAGFPTIVYNGEHLSIATDLKFTSKDRSSSLHFYREALANVQHPVWNDLRDALKKLKPRYVGISLMTPVYSSALMCAKIVKEVLPDSVVITGGPHCILFPEQMARLPEVDYVVIGEGDYTLKSLVRALENKTDLIKVSGIAYKSKNGQVTVTKAAQRVDDLGALPIPDRKLLYKYETYDGSVFSNLLGSRGCPFNCYFCASVPLWQRKVRVRPVEHVIKEIEYLIDAFDVDMVRFFDDTFTINKETLKKFCAAMMENGLHKKVRWSSEFHVNQVDDELFAIMKEAGCVRVSIGVESGSDRILTAINKKITTDDVRAAVKIIRKNGIQMHTYFMIGLPMETADDIRATIAFIKELKPDSMNLCTFTPFPGTVIFDDLVSKGIFDKIIDPRYYDNIAMQNTQNYFALNIPREQYDALLSEAMLLSERVTLQLTRTDIKAIFKKLTSLRFIGRILKKPSLIVVYIRALISRIKFK